MTWAVNWGVISLLFNDFFRWSTWGIIHAVLFETLIFLIVSSHFRALLTDPGSVDRCTVSRHEFRHCLRLFLRDVVSLLACHLKFSIQVSLEKIKEVMDGPIRVDSNGVPVPKPRCLACVAACSPAADFHRLVLSRSRFKVILLMWCAQVLSPM